VTASTRAALGALYTQFTGCNAELKQLAFGWQQREGEVNDHTDAVYDQAILDRLAGMHARFAPVLDRLIAVAPRLAPYPLRFSAAMARIAAGDHAFLLRPVIDSYHTVWMELHEDLIGLAGRTRREEALAGRAE
jgi:pyruvate,orthophosphate dikinase